MAAYLVEVDEVEVVEQTLWQRLVEAGHHVPRPVPHSNPKSYGLSTLIPMILRLT